MRWRIPHERSSSRSERFLTSVKALSVITARGGDAAPGEEPRSEFDEGVDGRGAFVLELLDKGQARLVVDDRVCVVVANPLLGLHPMPITLGAVTGRAVPGPPEARLGVPGSSPVPRVHPAPAGDKRLHLVAFELWYLATLTPPDAAILTRVILRIWKANIDPARAEEYERFAHERSLPMFRSHRGFRGCAFLRIGADCTVVTLWAGPGDVAALEASSLYRETVAAIMAAGFVRTAEEALAVPVLL